MRRVYNAGYIGGLTATAAVYAIPFFTFFYPPMEGSSSGGAVAKDKVGKLVSATEFRAQNQENRSLVQGIKGDPTYIIVKDDKILDVGVNAVCTHLGCVVPWNKNAEQFQCPCHGSRYNFYGKVVRGPAPLALPLTHVNVDGESITITPWTETDFRTGEAPWWK